MLKRSTFKSEARWDVRSVRSVKLTWCVMEFELI